MAVSSVDLECQRGAQWYENSQTLMGTFVKVALFHNDESCARDLIYRTFLEIQRQANLLSDWEEMSEVSILRKKRYLEKPSFELRRLVSVALAIKEISGGIFTPFGYSLSQLWRQAAQAERPPPRAEVAKAVGEVASTKVTFGGNGELLLHGPSGLDFGGIGKGYIADNAIAFLAERGVKFARIDCGGDLRFLGETEWNVDIENPRQDGILGSLKIYGSLAVATSGDYRNCFFYDGMRYHHLVNPKDGMPAHYCQQVTVVHQSATVADALASILFLSPPLTHPQTLRRFPVAKALVVKCDGEVIFPQRTRISLSHLK